MSTQVADISAGTTRACYAYQVIAAGSSCYSVQQQYGIDFNYFQSLNPSLNVACSNRTSSHSPIPSVVLRHPLIIHSPIWLRILRPRRARSTRCRRLIHHFHDQASRRHRQHHRARTDWVCCTSCETLVHERRKHLSIQNVYV